jgi:hypothetical protein
VNNLSPYRDNIKIKVFDVGQTVWHLALIKRFGVWRWSNGS